jgi:signal transduction histidine kinase
MSGTASLRRSRYIEVLWAVFAVANVYAMVHWPQTPTIPFHFIWISLTLIYALRIWSLSTTLLVLGAVCLATGLVLGELIEHREIDWEEITEVPLMAVVFLVVVWHARRRQAIAQELERAAAAERAQRQREQTFARQASHELRSPLSLARGHVQLVQHQLPPGPEFNDLQVALDQLDRVTAVTRRLLSLGTMENGLTLQRRRTKVDDVVRDGITRWAAMHRRRWIGPDERPVFAMVDPDRFAAALDELLDNAVAQTEPEDTIAVTLRGLEGDLLVYVYDSGPAIPPEHREQVFDTFWRGAKERYDGTGLGLSIVRAVTSAHGGEARVVPIPREGATFMLTFPGAILPDAAPVRRPREFAEEL